MILCANPKAQYLRHQTAIERAIREVLNSGYYINGPFVKQFEKDFSRYILGNSGFGVGVGNGTDALRIALEALNVGDGEVITVSHTAVATVAAVRAAGATPVLVDIDPVYYTIDPAKIEEAITDKTRAVICVHLYGQPGALDKITEICKRKKLFLIEDCAQAHGAAFQKKTVGSVGDVGCFSFYPTKNLGAIGDGGMVVTANSEISEKLFLRREYGWKERYISVVEGNNSRLDELQAAILCAKLEHLDKDTDDRIRIANIYNQELAGLPLVLPKIREGARHAFHLYVVRTDRRAELQKHLTEAGVQTMIHYPAAIHLQPAYKGKIRLGSNLAVTEKAAEEVLSLPMYPELSVAEVDAVIKAVRSFFRK
ncbi:MAG: DegT/DnrJ/EryC1/StrS family aminotransferase [Oligoflexales bacterium]